MARPPTTLGGAVKSGAQDVACVKRLRWWLVLGVLIVGYDFARISVTTLSASGQAVHAVTAMPLRPANADPLAEHATDAATAPPGPAASREPPEGVQAVAEADIDGAAGAAFPQRDRAAHAILWQGQLVIGSAVWTYRRLAELPTRLDEAVAREWASRTAGSHAVRADTADRSPTPSHETAYRAHGASTSTQAARLLLRNRTGTGSTVHFLVEEQSYALFPGEELKLPGRRWIVRFHRGGDFGDAAYSLWPGSYEFFVTRRGWELARKDPDASAGTP